ncbi:hypothetical protein DSO57_1007793, partial [Entomophthora muscae]
MGQPPKTGSLTSPEEETKNLPIECGPPRDDQPHKLIRKFKYSQFKPANKLTPARDAIQDWNPL